MCGEKWQTCNCNITSICGGIRNNLLKIKKTEVLAKMWANGHSHTLLLNEVTYKVIVKTALLIIMEILKQYKYLNTRDSFNYDMSIHINGTSL